MVKRLGAVVFAAALVILTILEATPAQARVNGETASASSSWSGTSKDGTTDTCTLKTTINYFNGFNGEAAFTCGKKELIYIFSISIQRKNADGTYATVKTQTFNDFVQGTSLHDKTVTYTDLDSSKSFRACSSTDIWFLGESSPRATAFRCSPII